MSSVQSQRENSALLQSIEVAKTLKQQNEELKFAFDDLKKEYIVLEEELINLRKEYENEIEAKKSLEMDCQNLYKKWNDELKIQAQEFEKIQSEMIPNTELELLRVKILEELETSYNEKLNWMKQEMEKYRNLYTKTLRELEILKSTHKNTQNSFENMLNEEKEGLNYKIIKLKQENKELKEENMNNNQISLKYKLQEFKTKNIEYTQQIQCLQKQINILNDKNSKLNIEIEEIKCDKINKIKEFEGKILIKNTECNGLKQKYDDLYKEYEMNKENYLFQQNKLQKLENNENYLKNLISNKKEEILNLNESFCKKEKIIKQQYDKEINILNDKIKSFETEINSINTNKENLKIEINKLNNKHLINIQQIKQNNLTDFNNLIESKQEIDEKYQEIKSKLIELQNESDKEIDSLKKEIETKTIRTEQTLNEKNNLSEINKKYEIENEELLNDIKCLKKENAEINNEYQALTNKYRDIMDLNHKLTSKENKYLTQIEYLENDIQEINNKIDDKLKNLTIKYENKINEINEKNKLLSSTMDENKANHLKSLNKLKKEKQKYKKLATMTKLKVNALSKEISNIKRNFQTELKSKSFEITNLNKQIYQIERQRDEIKFRLTMDSTNTYSSNLNKHHHTNSNDTDLITNNVDILLKELQIEQKQLNNTNNNNNNNNISLLTPKLIQQTANEDDQSNAENIET